MANKKKLSKVGQSTGGMEYSKGYAKRRDIARRKEEDYWASMNGPVTVTRLSEKTDPQ